MARLHIRASLRPILAASVALLGLARHHAHAAEGLDLTAPSQPADPTAATAPRVDAAGLAGYLAEWEQRAARVRASQPSWSSPLVTTTGLLEQRLRIDLQQEHSGNGTNTTVLDGGRGVDLIVSDANEVQFASDPYYIRTGIPGRGPKNKGAITPLSGFADWTFLRFEQRLASSPESGGNYVLTASLQVQAPTGIERLSGNSWQYVPTLAFGKGWGAFDVQGTFGAVLPAAHSDTIGYQLQTSIAVQYHLLRVVWPELEVNWTYYANGQRGGLSQVYLTPGLVIGRFAVAEKLRGTFGFGYQVAVTPSYRSSPLTPAYNHAWLFTNRLNF